MPAAVPFLSRRWVVPVLLIALPLLAFSPVFRAEFLTWDDYTNVARNPAMSAPADEAIQGWWTNLDKPYEQLYIPLTYTLWRVLAALARISAPAPGRIPLNATVFHTVNLLLHIGGTLLVFSILRRLIRHRWPAAIGAMLFAVHPVQVESVAWVTGLKDVLSGFLLLAASDTFARFIESRGNLSPALRRTSEAASSARTTVKKSRRGAAGNVTHQHAAVIWYIAATSLFVLAMLAKPSAVVGPLLAGLVGFAAVVERKRRSGATNVGSALRTISSPEATRSRSSEMVRGADPTKSNAATKTDGPTTPALRPVLLSFLPWLIPAALIAAETRHAQPATHIERTAVAARPFVAGDALAFYLRKIVVPVHLTPDYGHTPPVAEAGRWFHLAWLLPTGLLIAAALAWRKMPPLLIGLLWFIAALLPVLGFVPFSFQMYSTVADHYLYVAMAGVALIAAAIVDHWWGKPLAVFSGAAIVILGVLTFLQTMHWHDTVRLFTRNLAINPCSFVSYGQLGYLAAGAGDRETAAADYAAALQIRPDDFFTNFNFGNLLLHEGKPADAVEHYQAALASASDEAPLHNNYGVALIQLHRPADAMAEFQRALAIDPRFAEAKANLQRLSP